MESIGVSMNLVLLVALDRLLKCCGLCECTKMKELEKYKYAESLDLFS